MLQGQFASYTLPGWQQAINTTVLKEEIRL